MNNREKILEAARELYNEMGMKKVTARAICKRVGISPGSFSYHFPDSKLIVQNLFEQMQMEMRELMAEFQDREISVLIYLETHRMIVDIQLKYKFFYLNLIEILGSHEAIKVSYISDLQRDRALARSMLDIYMQAGVLRKDLEKHAVDRLIDVGQILNNFWALDAEIMPERDEKEMRKHYMQICCGLLEPYLTEDSKKVYLKYFEEMAA